jgi:hypothetical protein
MRLNLFSFLFMRINEILSWLKREWALGCMFVIIILPLIVCIYKGLEESFNLDFSTLDNIVEKILFLFCLPFAAMPLVWFLCALFKTFSDPTEKIKIIAEIRDDPSKILVYLFLLFLAFTCGQLILYMVSELIFDFGWFDRFGRFRPFR